MTQLKHLNFGHDKVNRHQSCQQLLTITLTLGYSHSQHSPFFYCEPSLVEAPLTIGEIKKAVVEAKALGAEVVIIDGVNDIEQVNYFWELLEFIKSQELNIVIYSYLTDISAIFAQQLKTLDVVVIARIASFKPELYQRTVPNIPDAFKNMQYGLINLLNAGFVKNKCVTMFAIEITVVPENIDELFQTWCFCRDNNIYPIVKTAGHTGLAQYEVDRLYVPYDQLVEQLTLIHQYDEGIGFYQPLKMARRFEMMGEIVGCDLSDCHRVGTNINVNQNGNVYTCFNMSKSMLGNIRKHVLSDIWPQFRAELDAGRYAGLCHCREHCDSDDLLVAAGEN